MSPEEVTELNRRWKIAMNLSVRACDPGDCSADEWEYIGDEQVEEFVNATGLSFNYYINFTQFNYAHTPVLYNVTVNYLTLPPPVVITNTTLESCCKAIQAECTVDNPSIVFYYDLTINTTPPFTAGGLSECDYRFTGLEDNTEYRIDFEAFDLYDRVSTATDSIFTKESTDFIWTPPGNIELYSTLNIQNASDVSTNSISLYSPNGSKFVITISNEGFLDIS
jgi:hypothetical protein